MLVGKGLTSLISTFDMAILCLSLEQRKQCSVVVFKTSSVVMDTNRPLKALVQEGATVQLDLTLFGSLVKAHPHWTPLHES